MFKFVVSTISTKSMTFNEFYWILGKCSVITTSAHFLNVIIKLRLYITFLYKIVTRILYKINKYIIIIRNSYIINS